MQDACGKVECCIAIGCVDQLPKSLFSKLQLIGPGWPNAPFRGRFFTLPATSELSAVELRALGRGTGGHILLANNGTGLGGRGWPAGQAEVEVNKLQMTICLLGKSSHRLDSHAACYLPS